MNHTHIRPLSIHEIARDIVKSGDDFETRIARLSPRKAGHGDDRDIRDAVRRFLELYNSGDPVVMDLISRKQ